MSVDQYFANKISMANVVADPFPHVVIDNFVPSALFDALLSSLPAIDMLSVLADSGNPALQAYRLRRTMRLSESLREPWNHLYLSLCAQSVTIQLLNMFELPHRPIEHFVALNCDLPGAFLTPHTDAPRKLVSAILYLKHFADGAGAGTSLYEPLEVGRVCLGGPHHNRSEFQEVSRIDFRPNRMFMFLKSNLSFHGLEEIAGDAPRYTVLHSMSTPPNSTSALPATS